MRKESEPVDVTILRGTIGEDLEHMEPGDVVSVKPPFARFLVSKGKAKYTTDNDRKAATVTGPVQMPKPAPAGK